MNDFQALCSALLENIILRKQLEFALQNTQSALKEAQTQLEGLVKTPPEEVNTDA